MACALAGRCTGSRQAHLPERTGKGNTNRKENEQEQERQKGERLVSQGKDGGNSAMVSQHPLGQQDGARPGGSATTRHYLAI